MTAHFGFIPVVPPFAGTGQQEAVVGEHMASLTAFGGVRRTADELSDPAPLCYLVATGGTESVVLDLHTRREALVPGEPVILITHPGNNSLPAALEVLARLHQDGTQGRIVHLRGAADPDGLAALESTLHDVRVRAALRSARIGLVGDPSDWLVASSPDPLVVSDVWGPEVVPIDMADLRSAIDAVSVDELAGGSASLEGGATDVIEPTSEDLAEVARIHAALRSLVAEHRLTAITVRCFDLVLERSTSGCFALSELTDTGVIAGCEGDLVSTIGLLWASLLTGEVPWMANPADLDATTNTLWLAHCTVPRTMVESYRLRSHFESGLGVGIQGTLPRGPVTLLRIGGTMMDALWLAEGDIVATGDAENLCRTQAEIVLARGDVSDLLSAPLGNHIVMIRGHHADRLFSWWDTML